METRSKALQKARTGPKSDATVSKSGTGGFQALCQCLIAETNSLGFLDDKNMLAATYSKLVSYRKRVVKERSSPAEHDDDFVASEHLERKLIAACEQLYNALWADHTFKIFGFKEPRITPLDGRNSTKWAAWRLAFDREVHCNVNLSQEQSSSISSQA